MTKKPALLSTLLAVAGITAGLILAGYLIAWGAKKLKRTPATTPAVTFSTGEKAPQETSPAPEVPQEVTKLIEKFEKLQQKQQAQEVLAQMTPPATPPEKEAYNFLLGVDMDPSGQAFRLYNTAGTGYKLTSYQIKECQWQSERWICSVEETRQWWNNVEGRWTPALTRTFRFEIIQQDNHWQIEKYTDPQSESGVEKYSGFGV